MWLSYLKITLRNLFTNRLYSCINILGLAIGLASTILIGLFVLDETSYDRHFADAERIYRISRDFPTQNLFLAPNSPQVAPLLKQDFPDAIEYAARIFGGQALLSRDEVAFYENAVRFADNDVFHIFEFNWLQGNAATALTRPFTVVLSESIARKYFGDADALGQTLLLENLAPLEVTGVIADLPHNSHLTLDVAVSMDTILPIVGERFFNNWGGNNFHTYIKLKPGVAIETLASQFTPFLDRHQTENSARYTGMTAIPLTDIHLRSNRQFELAVPGSMTNIYVFSAAALFILLIACFNFMNLSTARAARRGREVGIRKSLGASRAQLVRQFFGESVLLTLLAAVLALGLIELALPAFNAFLGKTLTLALLSDLRVPALLAALVVFVGLFAGSYPALFLSRFKPAQVLRSVLASGGSAAFRNTMVVLQFAIAIVLVVATLVVMLQQRYASNIELGFQREQIVVLTGSPTAGFGPQWEAMRQELLRNPDILAATSSNLTPLEVNTNSTTVLAEGEEMARALPYMRVDYDFFATYDIPLLAGRGFSVEFPADRAIFPREGITQGEAGYVLNRLAAGQFGWAPEEAIGKSFTANFDNNTPHPGRIVGVVENSYFESVHGNLKPVVFAMPEHILVTGVATMDEASLRLSGRNMVATLAYIRDVWERFVPDFPLEQHFLDERYAALHQMEMRQGQLFNVFATMATLIACLGLYGLASFNAERRRKEIGVRKVMGGSVWSIVLLLTNDFSKLVLFANLIAWPVAWFAMDRWLENFAYRIDLTPLVFIGSGAIALCIAWVTVGGIAAKAASAKPVLALRYE